VRGASLSSPTASSAGRRYAACRRFVALARNAAPPIILEIRTAPAVMGKHGRGTAEHHAVEDQIDIITGTWARRSAARLAAMSPVENASRLPSTDVRPHGSSNACRPPSRPAPMKAIEILEREPAASNACTPSPETCRRAEGGAASSRSRANRHRGRSSSATPPSPSA